MRQRLLALLIALVAPLAAEAGDIVAIAGETQLRDVWRFPSGTVLRHGLPDIAEVEREQNQRNVHPDLCGMHVVAHARSEAGEELEWNLLFTLVHDGAALIGGVSAAAFTIRPGAPAEPRPALTELSIALSNGEWLTTRPIASGAGRHGVVAPLPFTGIEAVWDSLDQGLPITIGWTDDSGESRRLSLRTLGTQRSRSYHGRNMPARRCAALLAPDAGTGGVTREVDHPW